ncbi:MAG: hypothetical protein LBO07_07790 [Coriobacteriales bacterium]|nr:hypothetical protein [Coriobacteriales bacterium]
MYLYEVTEQDILFSQGSDVDYRPGNVLIFTDKRSVELGHELARADDISAAREFLDHEEQLSPPAEESSSTEDPAKLSELLREKDETLRSLTRTIEQRDELLQDISESLKVQRQDNELLHAMLEATREQLAAHELSQSELVDDLQMVSVEAMSRESTLEHVLDEKFQLEQELAERITELLEMSLINDDLRYQLKESARAATAPVAATTTAEDGSVANGATSEASDGFSASGKSGLPATSNAGADARAPDDALPAGDAWVPGSTRIEDDTRDDARDDARGDARIVTVSSGKQIHVYHEFPSVARPNTAVRLGLTLISIFKVALVLVAIALVLLAASVVATAQVNGCSLGTALDLFVKSLTPR